MSTQLDLWNVQDVARRWVQNWKKMHASQMGGVPPFPDRMLISATMDPHWQTSTLEKTSEALRDLSDAGHDVVPAVAHPNIREFDDWYKVETWLEITDAYKAMEEWITDGIVGYDIEPYMLKGGQRYPGRNEIAEESGWKLTDAMRPLITFLLENDITILIEQAHESHLMELVLRIAGVKVIWADSRLKAMTYDTTKNWTEIGVAARRTAHQSGAKRYATILARDLATPAAVAVAKATSDGRINVFWRNRQDTAKDERRTYMWNYPMPGWADLLLA